MTRRPSVTLTLDRTILEHPRALHIRRMRTAVWLYLVLLSRLPAGEDTIEIEPQALSDSTGLPHATITAWLGHLKKGRYVAVVDRNERSVRVRIKRLQLDPVAIKGRRHFTVESLERALGESGFRERLIEELARHPPERIRDALDRATDVPRSKIRRSRTALFLYLLNHYEENQPHDPRH